MIVHVGRAAAADRTPLLELWERAVRATHHFLTDADVVALRPLVAEELAGDAVEWWVARDDAGALVGLLGYTRDTIEALFLDPAHRGRGVGRQLVDHAQRLGGETLAVDVNEQNEAAVGFYEALAFNVVSRSSTDAGGRPFPVLHMRRTKSPRSGTSGAETDFVRAQTGTR